MRRLVVSQFVAVDGVVDSPGDEVGFDRAGWAFRFDRGEEGNRHQFDEVGDADALLLGRFRRQDQRRVQIRRVGHTGQSKVEQHDGAPRRRRS